MGTGAPDSERSQVRSRRFPQTADRVEHWIMHEDPPRRSNQQGADGKENVRDQKSKNQRLDKFAGTAAKGKGKAKSCHTPYLPVSQELQ